uniref:W2 domain-containing protein n=1 Tax=Prolemur simus TaxID=1328070 RepID=A0A8C8ZMP8_PROSS
MLGDINLPNGGCLVLISTKFPAASPLPKMSGLELGGEIYLYNENLVKEVVSAAFAVKLFKSLTNEKDINAVAASLWKVSMDNRLMELFPANRQSIEHFTKYFTEAGLKELSEYVQNQQTIGTRKELQKELQQMSPGDPFKNTILYKIVVLFYKAEVLSEEPILKWYKDAHVAMGNSIFLEQMKKFVEWLTNVEEVFESEGEEGD